MSLSFYRHPFFFSPRVKFHLVVSVLVNRRSSRTTQAIGWHCVVRQPPIGKVWNGIRKFQRENAKTEKSDAQSHTRTILAKRKIYLSCSSRWHKHSTVVYHRNFNRVCFYRHDWRIQRVLFVYFNIFTTLTVNANGVFCCCCCCMSSGKSASFSHSLSNHWYSEASSTDTMYSLRSDS